MSTHFVITIATVVVATLIISACHHSRHNQSRHDSEHALKHLSKKLDLDVSQQQQVAAIISQVSTLKDEQGRLKKEWEDYARQTITVDADDPAETDRFVKKQSENAAEISRRFANSIAEIKEVLNDEQEDKLITLLDKHSSRKRKH